jgi:hypothetical protein
MPLFEMKGRLGISVKRNKHDVGTDMMKLKEIAEAFSVKFGRLKSFKKCRKTAYKFIPWNPGGDHFLLFFTRYVSGLFFLFKTLIVF